LDNLGKKAVRLVCKRVNEDEEETQTLGGGHAVLPNRAKEPRWPQLYAF